VSLPSSLPQRKLNRVTPRAAVEYFHRIRYNDFMRRLSTALTFVNKRIFPGIWFAIVAFVACMAIAGVVRRGEPVFILLFPLAMAVGGYVVMKMLIFDLMDEVYLDGDDLVVRNRGDEARIPLAHVINVNATIMTNPERITLMLSEPSKFGDEITFSPTHRWFPFSRHPLAKELISRAQEARKRGGSVAT
jgi:hypothetical protein